ncbi:MAG: HAMP domain-containing sensor histidine kinase [Slackia sp.]|nr:HAMP domain-containing sensor histidine kinase [Slackia sp.]
MDSLKSTASARFRHGSAKRSRRRHGMPLSLFLIKYFIYILLGTFSIAGATVSLLIVAVDSGALYPANYASINRDATVGAIETRGTADADDIPSCYRWGIFDERGRLIESDFDAFSKDLATGFLNEGSEDAVVYSSPFGSPVYAASAALEDGGTCVLVYDFNPDFVSKELRDALPDPQGMILFAAAALFAGMVALIAVRASRMLKRKLAPLTDAAQRIGRRELDFDIAKGTIRETNDILEAVDDMRASLKASLEEQWTAEQAQRKALSALAHDLKTPLTIVRGNADLILETDLDEEQSSYARFIREASRDMEGFIGRIIDVSRASECALTACRPHESAKAFCDKVIQEVSALVAAYSGRLVVECDDVPERFSVAAGPDIVQTVMNVANNAIEYGTAPVRMSMSFRIEKMRPSMDRTEGKSADTNALLIAVENDGAGFSKSALLHATKRFYRDDAARSLDGHHGLGLAIARERLESCGGSVLLENTTRGARVTLILPCHDDR